MLIELELAALIALQAAALIRTAKTRATTTHETAARELPLFAHPFEIVKRGATGEWQHVGHRHAGHPDLHEARRTPGLAIRHQDGTFEEGRQ